MITKKRLAIYNRFREALERESLQIKDRYFDVCADLGYPYESCIGTFTGANDFTMSFSGEDYCRGCYMGTEYLELPSSWLWSASLLTDIREYVTSRKREKESQKQAEKLEATRRKEIADRLTFETLKQRFEKAEEGIAV